MVLTASEDSTDEEQIADGVSLNILCILNLPEIKQDIQESPTSQHRKKAPKNVVSPELPANLGRTKLSDRKATL